MLNNFIQDANTAIQNECCFRWALPLNNKDIGMTVQCNDKNTIFIYLYLMILLIRHEL